MRRLRILLCDDHQQILTLLQTILEPYYQIVGTAADGQSMIAAVQALRPDIVLTDIDMPILNGIEAAREVHQQFPDCRIIFHTFHSEPEILAAAYVVGASGYLVKGSPKTLVSSIQTIVRQASIGETTFLQSRNGRGTAA